jgi:pullulanase/glycogen debranching enzyme
MPVHQYAQDGVLRDQGLSNYWCYNTIGFFAPHNSYAASTRPGSQVQEFKSMVKALHAAGIEVLLDVVYNHTAEGNEQGPTLSFKGIDNSAYYRLVQGDLAHYDDTTGTGNSLSVKHPAVLQLIMDSLRYWVTEMHVDGFRFDLAATLARQFHEVDRLSAFFDLVQQDPVVSQVKLIAEPWDIGTAATRSATSLRFGQSGTASTAMRYGTSGAVPNPRCRSWLPASPGRRTSINTRVDVRWPASTSSQRMTDSPCVTWSRTTKNTTRPKPKAGVT